MNHIYSERAVKLFTPGPVNIPERVHVAAMLGSYHHRTPEFSSILKDTLAMLKPLFGTENTVMPVHTTGRGALEGIYNNVFSQGDRVICVVNGKFGEMAAQTLRKDGMEVKEIFPGWDTPVDLDELDKAIAEYKATGLVAVFNDTSNGIINPIDRMGEIARKHDALFIVDDVSALACMPFKMDEWKVDAVATASQKGLMSPVGVSFVAMNDRAFAACEKNAGRDFYIDFLDIRKIVEGKGETPGSTPVSIVLSVHEALNMINEEGLDNVFLRHKAISVGTKSGLEALGFSLYPISWEKRSDSLTVARVPEGISAKALTKRMCDGYRLKLGTGLGNMGDEYVRIAHMGYCYVEDMIQCISVMECVLEEMGMKGVIGKGVKAFIDAYGETLSRGVL